MKRKQINFPIFLLLLITGFNLNAQSLGNWVVPSYSPINSGKVYKLNFTNAGITSPPTELLTINQGELIVSGGAYDESYNLDFFAVKKSLFCNGVETPLYSGTYSVLPSLAIVNRPGMPNDYVAVYIREGSNNDFEIFNSDISFLEQNNTITVNSASGLPAHSGGWVARPAFTFSPEIGNGERYLYLTSVREETSSYITSLRRWKLTSSGFQDETILLEESSSGPLNDERYFEAYDLEVVIQNGVEVIAWSHSMVDDFNSWNHTDEVVVVVDEVPFNFDLDYGRIGGIEFSKFEENILYASCTERGIVKLNYVTGQVSDVYAPSTPNYSRTYLQTAPDGHIYAVSNDGTQLGSILQHGNGAGSFEAAVFEFPVFGAVSTYQTFENLKYFILPENERKFSPLSVQVTTEPESCPDYYDGRAEIFVSGGVPFDDEDAPYLISPDPTANWQWDVDDFCFYNYELTAGNYEYTITDNATPVANTVTVPFVIELDNSHFSFQDNYLPIESNTSLPDATYPNTFYTFEKGIHISNGATLTINNSEYEFGPDASIIIEPGAKLIVNNTILTNSKYCAPDFKLWKGIEVRGNSEESQLPEYIDQQWVYHQGRIYLNGATISNAETAIATLKRDAAGNIFWNTGGGIVTARDSDFINNNRALAFIPYKPGNISWLTACNFIINEEYLPGNTFYKHVDLNEVYDIRFTACDFSLSPHPDVSPSNQAIAAYNSSFRVLPGCSSLVSPCPEENIEPTQFTGFYRAIGAYNTNAGFYVDNAVFTANSTGIYASNANNFIVLSSKFYIGANPSDKSECEAIGKIGSGYGINSISGNGFAIEENYFTKAEGAPTGTYTGIRIAETQATDQVYKNTFEGLSYGNYAVGRNFRQPTYFTEGLAYYCNNNTANFADFYVEPDGTTQITSGIQSKQGNDQHVTGNKFTPSGAAWHFYNGGDYLVGHYFCDYCTSENPDDDKEFYVTDKPKNFDNNCLSHYGGGSGRGLVLSQAERQDTEMEFATNLADYNNVKTLYDNLKDGGNTEATIEDIETAWPNEMWELRSELLGKSPHLSLDVLKATADKTDVLPDNVIFEIMAANPDELKKEELIKYLEDKANPLPEYMVNILRQVAEGSTYKTILEQEMAHYNQIKTRAAYDIIRSNLNDSVTNMTELRNWLDNVGGKRADEQIIASYIAENNYTDALALANMMPALYDFSGYELTEHNYYMDMLNLQIQLTQEGRTVYELDTNEVNNLVTIAENNNGTAGAQAKGILEFAYGHHFCNCLNVSDATGSKSSGMINLEDFAKAYGLEVTSEPNPASEWVVFNYTLPYDKSEGTIKIVDTKGAFVTAFKVSGIQGQKVWDTRKLNSGVYFYTLRVGEFVQSGKIVISK